MVFAGAAAGSERPSAGGSASPQRLTSRLSCSSAEHHRLLGREANFRLAQGRQMPRRFGFPVGIPGAGADAF